MTNSSPFTVAGAASDSHRPSCNPTGTVELAPLVRRRQVDGDCRRGAMSCAARASDHGGFSTKQSRIAWSLPHHGPEAPDGRIGLQRPQQTTLRLRETASTRNSERRISLRWSNWGFLQLRVLAVHVPADAQYAEASVTPCDDALFASSLGTTDRAIDHGRYIASRPKVGIRIPNADYGSTPASRRL